MRDKNKTLNCGRKKKWHVAKVNYANIQHVKCSGQQIITKRMAVNIEVQKKRNKLTKWGKKSGQLQMAPNPRKTVFAKKSMGSTIGVTEKAYEQGQIKGFKQGK